MGLSNGWMRLPIGPVRSAIQELYQYVGGLSTSASTIAAITQQHILAALGYTPVNRTGDTMRGALVLDADPVAALGAATKQYVDAAEAAAASYTDAAEAAANAYTDAAIAANPSGLVAADIVTVPDGGTFALVFTDDGDVVAID